MVQKRKTTTIPKAPAARILMKSGAKRVADQAAAAFSSIIHEKALAIAEKAARIAKHSGRKTVQEEDIRLAARS